MQNYKWLRCQCCGRSLVLTNGVRLVFSAGGYCDEPVALKCQGCGSRRYWKPLKDIDIRQQEVYTDPIPA